MARQVLEVFLSSTALDLVPYRDAVYARLARIEVFHCVRQEDFGARNAEAVAFCCERARAADLFVGLIGMRRGWEPEGDIGKRSITEIEHDCAKDAGRKRFIWVSPDNFPVPGNIHETRAEYRRQLAFRARVMAGGEIIVSQKGFTSPEDLASTVVEQLLVHVMTSDLIKYVRPEAAAPTTDSLALKELPGAIVGRLIAALDARGEIAKAASGGLERDIIVKLAMRLKRNEVLGFDQAVAALENAVGIALDSIARGQHGANEDDFVNAMLARVGERTKAGEFDQATKEVDAALVELDRREIVQREALRQSRIALLEAGIEQNILRRDALAVALRVQRIAATEEPADSSQRFKALRRRQNTFHIEGRDRGLNFSLEIAIEIARLALNNARDPGQRVHALNDLATSLATLGERESGTARLQEAVAAFRVLLEYNREHVQSQWAIVQNNLGCVLQFLGERASDTAFLEDAITAFRNALLEYTRERTPLDWAMTQSNLGNALRALGERESGTARLDEAVTAFRNALLEYTRERTPQQWAMARGNLGNALVSLGVRESDSTHLEEAVTAFRDALLECARESVPLQWAAIQNNLGNALANLGLHDIGSTRLEEAVTAFRNALLEHTRDRVPLDWAMTQNDLGCVLQTLGERERSAARVEEALVVFRNALLEYTRERVPIRWAVTQNNIGNALRTLGEWESGTSRLEEALAAYHAAIEVFEQAQQAGYYLEGARQNLARAEALMASRRSDDSD